MKNSELGFFETDPAYRSGLRKEICMNYGYVRVSTATQNERRQVAELKKRGLQQRNIYVDKQSGKNFNRPGYNKLIRRLKAGDTLYVNSIDRFGRNYKEILEQWTYLTKKKKIDIVVTDMPLLDTRKTQEDLLGIFITDIVLQILSYVAETQRRSIKHTQAQGIREAKKKGVTFGRPRVVSRDKFLELYSSKIRQGWTVDQFCKKAGISRGTYYKYLHDYISEKRV